MRTRAIKRTSGTRAVTRTQAGQRNSGQDETGTAKNSETRSTSNRTASPRPARRGSQGRRRRTPDPTGRTGERTPQPQQNAGREAAPRVKPQDSPQNFKLSRNAARRKAGTPKRLSDDRTHKSRKKNAKAIDQNTDKLYSKSARDEHQSNSKGDEQSDVGKTGDTKRSNDKNSPLSQKGTDNAGAKEKTTEQGPASKEGKEKPSQNDQTGQQRPGQEGGPPKPGQQSPGKANQKKVSLRSARPEGPTRTERTAVPKRGARARRQAGQKRPAGTAR